MENTGQSTQDAAKSLRLYLRYARRTMKYPGTILVSIILCFGLACAKHFLTTKLYESSTLILIQSQKIPEEFIKSTVTHSVERYINTLSKQVMSRSRLEKIIVDMDLYPNRREKDPMDDVIQHMRSNIKIDVYGKESFRITYLGQDPKTAQAVCSELSGVFINENVSTRTKQAKDTREFLSTQTAEAKAKLDKKENELRQYKEGHLGELPSQESSNSQALSHLTSRLESLSEDIRNARNRKILLQTQLTETVFEGDPSEVLRRELGGKRTRLRALQLEYTENHPDVIRLKSEVTSLEQRIARGESGAKATTRTNKRVAAELKVIEREIGSLLQEQRELKSKIKDYNKRQARLPKVAMNIQSLERERKTLQRNYLELLAKKEEAERAEALEAQKQGQQFKVLESANQPGRASGPGLVKLGGVGFILGLFLGLALAALRVLMDTRIYEPEDLSRYLDADILVSIPKIKAPPVRALPKPEA